MAEIPLRTKNTFLHYEINFKNQHLRRTQSDPSIYTIAEREILQTEDNESNMLEIAIEQANQQPFIPTNEFKRKAMKWFNKLLQRYLEVGDIMKTDIRNLKEGIREWDRFQDKRKLGLLQNLYQNDLDFRKTSEESKIYARQNHELNVQIAEYLSNNVKDKIFLMSQKVSKAREDMEKQELERDQLLLEFHEVSGARKNFLEKAFKYYDTLQSKHEKAIKLLSLRKGVLNEALKDWENADQEKKEWLAKRNEKLSHIGLVLDITAFKQAHETLLESILWHVTYSEEKECENEELMARYRRCEETSDKFEAIGTEVTDLLSRFYTMKEA